MTDTCYIQDENLISARFHGIELEVERLGGELVALLSNLVEQADAALSQLWIAGVEELEGLLTRLLVHVWPSPADPVVVSLRAEAAQVVERAWQAKAQLFPAPA